jgi:hypothetical protein
MAIAVVSYSVSLNLIGVTVKTIGSKGLTGPGSWFLVPGSVVVSGSGKACVGSWSLRSGFLRH